MSNDLSERLDRVEEALDIIVRDAQMGLPEAISPAAVRRIRALLSPVLPFSDAAVAGDIPAHREATNSTDPATARWQCADCGSWNLKERFDCHECGGFVPPRPAGRSFKGTAPFGAGPHDDSSASIGAAVAKESAGGATPPIGTEPPTTHPLSEEREREIRAMISMEDVQHAFLVVRDLLSALDHERTRAEAAGERNENNLLAASTGLDHNRERANAAEALLADALRYKAAVERLNEWYAAGRQPCLTGLGAGWRLQLAAPWLEVWRPLGPLEAIEAVPLPGGAKT